MSTMCYRKFRKFGEAVTLPDITSRLENVKGSGDKFTARCPCHDDKHNSLSVSQGDNDNILIHCHAGCLTENIVSTLGFNMSDLFHEAVPDKFLDRRRGKAQQEGKWPLLPRPHMGCLSCCSDGTW